MNPTLDANPMNAALTPIHSPVDGRLLGEVPVHGAPDVRAAVERARAAQQAWGQLSVRARCQALRHVRHRVPGKRHRGGVNGPGGSGGQAGEPPATIGSVAVDEEVRIEGERVALPGPAMTPYLVGMLVLLGMLGTFLGMVVTLNGAVIALESTTDLHTIRAALAPNLPPDEMLRALRDPDLKVRQALVDLSSEQSWLQRHLAVDADPSIRSYLALSRQLLPEVSVMLAGDLDEEVRHALASNRALPECAMPSLARDPSGRVRLSLVMQSGRKLAPELVALLAPVVKAFSTDNAYTATTLTTLRAQVATLQAALESGDVAASRAAWTAGSRRPTSVPMMAMTTSSSTSVKPEYRRMGTGSQMGGADREQATRSGWNSLRILP